MFDPVTDDPNAPGIPIDIGETAKYTVMAASGLALVVGIAWGTREVLRRREFRRLLASVVAPFRGSLPFFPVLDPFPPARFRLGRYTAELSFQPFTIETPSLTRFSVPLALQADGRIRILSRALQEDGREPPDAIPTGDPETDRIYSVQSNRPDLVRAFLTPEVRSWLKSLQWKVGSDDLYVEVNRSRFVVQKRGILTDERELAIFIDQSLRLTEHLLRILGAPGIKRSESGTPSPADGTIPDCAVCRRPILAESLLCAVCRAAHHPSCWDSIGQCATFNCRGREHVPGPTA